MKRISYFLLLNFYLVINLISHAELPLKVEEHRTGDEKKATSLYKLPSFVTWRNPMPPYQFCLLGEIPLISSGLEVLFQRDEVTPDMAQIVVLPRTDFLTQINRCHLLFIGQSEQLPLPTILSSIQSLPILTVSDITNFASLGGMIEFYEKDNKIRLKINLQAVSDAQLRLSSHLLRIATIVETNKDNIIPRFLPPVLAHHSEELQSVKPAQSFSDTITNDHDARSSEDILKNPDSSKRVPINSGNSPPVSIAQNIDPQNGLPPSVIMMTTTENRLVERIAKNNTAVQQADPLFADAEKNTEIDLSTILKLLIVIIVLLSLLVILSLMILLKTR